MKSESRQIRLARMGEKRQRLEGIELGEVEREYRLADEYAKQALTRCDSRAFYSPNATLISEFQISSGEE